MIGGADRHTAQLHSAGRDVSAEERYIRSKASPLGLSYLFFFPSRLFYSFILIKSPYYSHL